MTTEKALQNIIETLDFLNEQDFKELAHYLYFYNIKQVDDPEYHNFNFNKFKNETIARMAHEISLRDGFDTVWKAFSSDYAKCKDLYEKHLTPYRTSFNYLAVTVQAVYLEVDGVEVIADDYLDWDAHLIHYRGQVWDANDVDYHY